MSASLYTPIPPRRGPEYCVDCYAVDGRVTVATRMFKDDALCERHYLTLCKELEIEPEVKVQHPAAPARLQDRSESDSVDSGGIAGAAIHKTRSSRSVSSGPPAGVLTRAVVLPNRGSRHEGITSEHLDQARQGGETPTKVSDFPISKQVRSGPDAATAPAAEGRQDRAHSPTHTSPSDDSGVPQAPSAVKPQPLKPERSAKSMAKLCGAPGCGKKLQDRNQSGYCGKHFNFSRYSGGEPGRVCSINGCETKLRRDNTTGVCKEHKNIAVNSATAAKAGAKKRTNDHATPMAPLALSQPQMHVAPLANGNGHTSNGRENVKVTCSVSELSMDRIWTKLTPDEKAQLLFPQETETPAHA
jgi:hypothetical protein